MADPTDVPAPLSDRTLVHGRNVMAAAGVIMVLDYENLNRMALAFIRLASIRLMLRRVTRYCVPS